MSSLATVLASAPGAMSSGETIAFVVLAPLAVLGALGMLFSRNAVHSALWLVATMLSLGVFYMAQAGPFLGVIQIIVYTGAIMILFVFVLMLVGRDSNDSMVETLRGQRAYAAWFGVGLAALIGAIVYSNMSDMDSLGVNAANAEHGTNVRGLAALIFTDYVGAVQLSAALLIVATLGAVVLAHIERGKPRSQKERALERFASDQPHPLPGPGVFATSHSVATPALLPDGSIAEESQSTGVEMLPMAKGHLIGRDTQPRHDAAGTRTISEGEDV
ncbi:NADH-quinone oxidoreductase subunit J [Blastococcus sp. Marseille-P5729]|uniref:NADH-quinone oxidoreductase subunit J n=1 Tax=Blastococcus sp. Marseille-P5729 TaxID=2086582 RepID=UPI000D0FECBB|nr:NADH-quinone oxidoreductase subunit J [Blastococcus sp. Marseille-P5729]